MIFARKAGKGVSPVLKKSPFSAGEKMSSEKKYEMDMCHGPLFGKVLRYSVPLMIANIAALLFHAADLVVLGQFTDRNSMAAVGAAGGFIFLMLNLFWGIGTGINVLASRYTGARDPENVSRALRERKPFAVDVSSGIETGGFKDIDKMRAFVRAVRKTENAEVTP